VLDQPGQRRLKIGTIEIEPGKPGGRFRTVDVRVDAPGQRREIEGMPLSRVVRLASRGQLIETEFANGLQQRITWLVGRIGHRPDQAMIDQRLQGCHHGLFALVADGQRSRKRHPSNKDTEVAEERLLISGEQVVTPFDRVGHRPEPGRLVPGPAGEQGQPLLQPGQDDRRSEQVAAGGGQLDGQGQPVQAGANLGNGWRGRLGQRDARVHRFRPGDKQANGLRVDHLSAGPWRRQRHRRDRIHPLTAHPQRRATGDEQRHVRTGAEQLDQHRRGVGNLLKVVEHQQAPASRQVRAQPLDQGTTVAFPETQAVSDGGEHQRWIRHRGQGDKPHPIGERWPRRFSDRQRQPGLADPTRSGERQQPGLPLAKKIADRRDDILAPDEGGERDGQWRQNQERRRDQGERGKSERPPRRPSASTTCVAVHAVRGLLGHDVSLAKVTDGPCQGVKGICKSMVLQGGNARTTSPTDR